MLLSQSDFLEMKLEILRDLEKQLKSGYKSQYKGIMSNISIGTKIFKKEKLDTDYSSQLSKFNYVNASLTQHLCDVFDVFGDSAVLNAKMIFEENAKKWGRKISRKIQINNENIKHIVKNIYIGVEEYDHIEIDDKRLVWYFYKTCPNEDLYRYNRLWNIFYEIKKNWITALIKTFKCEFNFLEAVEDEANKIVTVIEINKE